MKKDTEMQLAYTYAELSCSGNRHYVYFSVWSPVSEKLERQRVYITREYRKNKNHGKNLVKHINKRLDEGWNPLMERKGGKAFVPIFKVLDFFLEFKMKVIRPSSVFNYQSRIRFLKDWLKTKPEIKFISQFTDERANEFMNHLLLTRKKFGNKTYNINVTDFRGYFNFLIEHKYAVSNPFKHVKMLPEQEKERLCITLPQMDELKEYLISNDPDFLMPCLYLYYCAIRPKEITMLKIRHFDLAKATLTIPGSIAKNHKTRVQEIPVQFLDIITVNFMGVDPDFFIVSENFRPGKMQIKPKKLGDHFHAIALKLKFPSGISFYSLKDTAAERMLESGFHIKDIQTHFGHARLESTESYLKRRVKKPNEKIKGSYPDL